MLTQTHTQQFSEWTSSRLRSPEPVKVPALTFVCNFALHTRVLTGSWVIFHRAPTFWCSRSCVNCNGKARDTRLAQWSSALPDFSHLLWSRRCHILPQSLFWNTGTTIYFLHPFRNYWGCVNISETIQPRQTFTQTKM